MINYQHLLGLHFEHGTQDCYEIIRMFYRDIFNIELRPYVRPDEWWMDGLNLYMDNFEKEGFDLVDVRPRDYRVGDILLVAIHAENPHHAGIFVGGERPILHHYNNRLSELSPLSGIWRNCLCAVIRHREVPDLLEEETTINVVDHLAPHFKAIIREKAPELLSE